LVTLSTEPGDAAVPVFGHPLARSAVFQSASYPLQADAHSTLAAALDSRPERQAWHLAQSVWHPDARISDMLDAVADALSARHGFHAAATAYERAAELHPDPRRAYARYASAAKAANVAGQLSWSLRLAQQAVAIGTEARLPAADLGWAQHMVAQGKVYLGGDANLVRDLLSAVRTATANWDTSVLVAMAATAAYYAPEPAQLAELRDILDRLPDPLRDPAAWDEPTWADPMLTYARAATSPFLPRADPLDDHGLLSNYAAGEQATTRSMFAAAAYLLDQPELAAQVAGQLMNEFTEIAATPTPTFLNMTASNNEMRGSWDQAAAEAGEALEAAIECGERFNVAFAHITMGNLAVRWGHTDLARRNARAADRAADGISRSVPVRTRHLHGLISLTEGDHQSAYTLLRGVLRTDEQVPAHYHLSHYAVADFALAAWHTGQQDDATEVLDGILAHANAITPGGAHFSRRMRLLHDLARALIAIPDEAEARYQQALSPGAERWPFDQACARLHYGELLRRQRRIADARPLLNEALDTFRELGAAPWARRAETELHAAGALSVQERPGPFTILTPQQRAVAELAAQGSTNPQIAARLGISPKTVSIHLGRVYEQLGINSRAQLRDLTDDETAPPLAER
jgi:DNA-binding CsgD family transcriptional regulator